MNGPKCTNTVSDKYGLVSRFACSCWEDELVVAVATCVEVAGGWQVRGQVHVRVACVSAQCDIWCSHAKFITVQKLHADQSPISQWFHRKTYPTKKNKPL
jgi:hypothetical protein